MQKASQRLRLLRAMYDNRWHSMPYLIRRMGGYRLSARIWEMRKAGWVIDLREKWVRGQRHTSYRLVDRAA